MLTQNSTFDILQSPSPVIQRNNKKQTAKGVRLHNLTEHFILASISAMQYQYQFHRTRLNIVTLGSHPVSYFLELFNIVKSTCKIMRIWSLQSAKHIFVYIQFQESNTVSFMISDYWMQITQKSSFLISDSQTEIGSKSQHHNISSELFCRRQKPIFSSFPFRFTNRIESFPLHYTYTSHVC